MPKDPYPSPFPPAGVKVGDRFEIVVEVTERVLHGDTYRAVVDGFPGNDPQYFLPEELLSGKRLSPVLKVGDPVRYKINPNFRYGDIKGIDGDAAWVRFQDSPGHWTIPLSDLEPAS